MQEIPESLYLEINGEMIREAALRTKGSSKSFKQSSTGLYDALATLTKTLCAELVDPSSIEAIYNSKLSNPFKQR